MKTFIIFSKVVRYHQKKLCNHKACARESITRIFDGHYGEDRFYNWLINEVNLGNIL